MLYHKFLKFRYIILVTIFLFNSGTLYAKNNKNVLILNSYHKGFQWSDEVINGIEEVFKDTNVDYTVLYMDGKRIDSNKYYEELSDIYKLQLKYQKFDLILAVDRFAYNFALQYYSKLFTNESLFFVGIEKYSLDKIKFYNLEHKTFGLLEKRAIDDIIQLIYKLMPNMKKLYIINDNSPSGFDTEPYIKKAIEKTSGKFEVVYIKKSTLEEFKNRFSKYTKDEAVFFVRFYNDKAKKLLKNSKIAEMIDYSKLPVFVTDTLFMQNGPVGGKLVLIKDLGQNAGKIAVGILEKKYNKPFIKEDDSYKYIFDYKKIKKFKLNPNKLDNEFAYVNTPISFFEKYSQIIKFILFAFPIFLLLGGILIYNLYLRLKNAKLLQARMEFNKALFNLIENPIVWQDKDGKIIEANSRFYNIMDFPSPNNKEITLLEHIQKSTFLTITKSLEEFITNKDLCNEIILKDKNDKEYIFFINQKSYAKDTYNNSGTVTVFTDITKERYAQFEKDKQQDFIIQQSKLAEIGEVFSSIAHQWKTPLVEIATISQEQLYNDNCPNQKSQYVDDILKQVTYMTETINDFQGFIMPSTKKSIFNIQDAVVKMLDIIHHNIKYNYIDVKVEVKPNTNLFIRGYKNELMQIMLNIVNNSKEAIIVNRNRNRDGVIIIQIENIDNLVQIQIKDNAGGISPQYINRIFEPYFSTKKEGNGIGLYMAKLIIEDKFNGTINVSNTEDGAKFIIRLETCDEDFSS